MPGFLEQIEARQQKLQQKTLLAKRKEKLMSTAEEEKVLATKVAINLHDRLEKLAIAYDTTKKKVTKAALERGLADLEKDHFLGNENELGAAESRIEDAKKLREFLVKAFGDKSIVVSAAADHFSVECSANTLIGPDAVPKTWGDLPVKVKQRTIPAVRGPAL